MSLEMRRLRTDCERREQHLQAVDLLQLQVLEVWTAPGHDVVDEMNKLFTVVFFVMR
jgi:hypothetical protein